MGSFREVSAPSSRSEDDNRSILVFLFNAVFDLTLAASRLVPPRKESRRTRNVG